EPAGSTRRRFAAERRPPPPGAGRSGRAGRLPDRGGSLRQHDGYRNTDAPVSDGSGVETMASSPYLTLILPAFNEVRTIGRTLRAIQSYLDRQPYTAELIGAADGGDGTGEAVAELARAAPRLSVHGSRERRGKGRGIRTSVAQARGRIIGFLDADYKVAIEELEAVLSWFERGVDIVI